MAILVDKVPPGTIAYPEKRNSNAQANVGSKATLSFQDRLAEIVKLSKKMSWNISENEFRDFLAFADNIMAKPPTTFTVYPVASTKLARPVEYTGKSVEIILDTRHDPSIGAVNPTKPNRNFYKLDLITLALRARSIMFMQDTRTTVRAFRTDRVFKRLQLHLHSHPYVMEVDNIGYFKDAKGEIKAFYFDSPFYSKGDLYQYIYELNETKPWNISHIRKLEMILEIAQALLFLKGKKVIHRDVKLDNIFRDDKGNIRVADFDLSYLEEERIKELGSVLGSDDYIPPEDVKSPGESLYPRDVYALGIIAYMFLTEDISLLIDEKDRSKTYKDFVKIVATFADKIQNARNSVLTKDEKDLVTAMLDQDPSKRAPIEQVVSKLEELLAALRKQSSQSSSDDMQKGGCLECLEESCVIQ